MLGKTHADRLRISANLLGAIGQIVVPILPALGFGSFVGQQSAAQDIPIVPAGYAFSIWSVIFLASALYAVYQALPRYREHTLFRRIGWYIAGAFLANTIWMIIAQFTSINWLTAVVICFVLGFALAALFLLAASDRKKAGAARTIASIPVSLLAGWVSAATALNIASVLDIQSAPLGTGIIGGTVLASSYVIWKTRGNLLYTLAIIWALIGIIVRQISDVNDIGILLVSGVGVMYIASLALFIRPRT